MEDSSIVTEIQIQGQALSRLKFSSQCEASRYKLIIIWGILFVQNWPVKGALILIPESITRLWASPQLSKVPSALSDFPGLKKPDFLYIKMLQDHRAFWNDTKIIWDMKPHLQ